MEFQTRILSIPPLGWCAVLHKDEQQVQLLVGSGVETASHSFAEGVWDGDFQAMDFDKAEMFSGSGGKIQGDVLTLSTANHNLDRIFIHRQEDVLYASNSLPFLLKVAKVGLDLTYTDYERDLCSIKNGLKDYTPSIPLAEGKEVFLYYCCNILIDKALTVQTQPKQTVPPVKSYEEYRDGMLEMLRKIADNAADPARKRKFGMVTTVSKGYDSACCAAMAKKVGCEIALTFDRPEKYADDNGDVVARQLGYTDIRYADASHYFQRNDCVEAFHTATGELGSTICFEAFEKEFQGNIVFYGERGDQFWNKNPVRPNGDYRFANQLVVGIGMAEWRLQVGFALMPIAFYKGMYWEDLRDIANSAEMEPWSIGGSYDRPLPRRICEEMGVERKEFGQEKKGAGFNYARDNMKRIQSRMSAASAAGFETFVKANKRSIHPWKQMKYLLKTFPDYLNYLCARLHLRSSLTKKDWDITNPGAPSYLVAWGVAECMKHYDCE